MKTETLIICNDETIHIIINKVFDLVQKYPKNLRCQKNGGSVENPLRGMLAFQRFGYMISTIYDSEKKEVNRILQFTTGNDYTVGKDNTIYILFGDEVSIGEESITITTTDDDGSLHESTCEIFVAED